MWLDRLETVEFNQIWRVGPNDNILSKYIFMVLFGPEGPNCNTA